ncbi:MAG: hypothetical protein IJU50_05615, partial [Lachnospiraceae bacterium]|nr:hypothetical protein [Lachnospiraceae bacterium]
ASPAFFLASRIAWGSVSSGMPAWAGLFLIPETRGVLVAERNVSSRWIVGYRLWNRGGFPGNRGLL